MSLIRCIFLLCFEVAVANAAPALTYSTYLRDSFTPTAITTDASGNIYLAGWAIIDASSSNKSALVLKLNPQASQYDYTSILNGQPNQVVNAIAVDAAGNAYVAGSYGAVQTTPQAFVAKLDPNGDTLFSIPLGGSASSTAEAIAVNASGQILVSGFSMTSGFPSTPGAYSVPDTTNRPWLVDLNPAGSQTVFSATGIGGSAMALDPAGNIYVAGTTELLDYPTTPGAYQTTFPTHLVCPFACFQGPSQYVSKIDPTGARLIYSTALSGSGLSANGGLAVDTGGNVYVTGFAGNGYPFTVTPPAIPPTNLISDPGSLPFLSKLDPAGQNLLFSVPVGGAGVQVSSSATLYVGGSIGSSVPGLIGSFTGSFVVNAALPGLAAVPSGCLPIAFTIPTAPIPITVYSAQTSAYASQVDAASGNTLATQFIGGSSLSPSAVALSGSTLWIAGATRDPNVPFTPNALTPPFVSANPGMGAYLGAVDFAQPPPPAGTPRIACVLDNADLAPIGPAAPYQLLSVVGTGLGPATGVTATDSTTTTLGGVQVSFGTTPAPILYASSTLINLAVPAGLYQFSPMQISVGGVAAPARALPLSANPSLFLNFQQSSQSPVPMALNADGSLNSQVNPAQLGSVISLFMNGLSQASISSNPIQLSAPPGWTVTSVQQATAFVQQVSLQTPSTLSAGNYFACLNQDQSLCFLDLSLSYQAGLGLIPVSHGPLGSTAGVFVKR